MLVGLPSATLPLFLRCKKLFKKTFAFLSSYFFQVNLSPSLNCDTPIDMKIKSALICDLLNLVGVAAVDPVLKRAQFNKKVKVNPLTQPILVPL